MRVVWTDQAALDVERIATYIAHENPIAARRVARGLLLAADSLDLRPSVRHA